MHLLVELHGQPGSVAALTPLSVDGMLVAAPTTLLAESRVGGRGGVLLPRMLLVVGSVASLGANLAVAEPTATGRVIAAWPSFALIASYELLMRQVRRAAETAASGRRSRRSPVLAARAAAASASNRVTTSGPATHRRRAAGRDVRLDAWRWAQDNRAEDGSLPSGKDIGNQYGCQERWGRLVKRSGLAGELGT